MTTTPMPTVTPLAKLTKAQRDMLERLAGKITGVTPRTWRSTCLKLAEMGLAEYGGIFEYRITDAGRAVLKEQSNG